MSLRIWKTFRSTELLWSLTVNVVISLYQVALGRQRLFSKLSNVCLQKTHKWYRKVLNSSKSWLALLAVYSPPFWVALSCILLDFCICECMKGRMSLENNKADILLCSLFCYVLPSFRETPGQIPLYIWLHSFIQLYEFHDVTEWWCFFYRALYPYT